MTTVGPGVREVRIQKAGQFRVIYTAKFGETIYALHAFQKKTQRMRHYLERTVNSRRSTD
jgi:phage-related protein